MKIVYNFILWGCLFLGVFISCEGEDELDEIERLEQEQSYINTFLKENVKGTLVRVPFYSKKGLLIDSLYIFNCDTTGSRTKEGEMVLLDYTVQWLHGGYMDSSDPMQQLDSNRFATYILGGPIYYSIDTSRRFDYMGEAVKYISEGDSGGEMVVPSRLGAQDGTSIHYKIKVHKVIPNIFEYEKELIAKYIQRIPNQIGTPIQDQQGDTIVYTIKTKQGSGENFIQEGAKITLSHTSAILDEIHLQQGALRAVEVWDSITMEHHLNHRNALSAYMQALTHLKEGDEAEIIIPHAKGYDRNNVINNATGQVLIPAYSTLIYRVKIHAVESPQTEE